MRKQLSDFCSQFNIQKTDRFLIAISGGIDSVVLTHLLQTQGFAIGLAHFNYKLRSHESEQDEHFVKQLAAHSNLTLHLNTANTKELASQQQKGIQEIARALRYNWFQELAKSTPYDWIVTGHHINDSVETSLLNLTKGTGLRGLKGIPPINQNIIRPLIHCTKDEIKAYAKANQLAHREDATNEKAEYQRNLIRLNVIPQLKQINPSLENTFLGNFKRAQGYLSIVEAFMEAAKEKLVTTKENTICIDGEGLLAYPAPETVLFELIRTYGVNAAQIADIIKTIPSTEEAVFFTNAYQVSVSRGQLTLLPRSKEGEGSVRLEITKAPSSVKARQYLITAKRSAMAGKALSYGAMTAYLDADVVAFPLVIRSWQQGDRFQPLGMDGKTKKLSDCFTDWKLNSIQKRQLLIVESGGLICWVIGHRLDHRFALGAQTKNVLKLTAEVL